MIMSIVIVLYVDRRLHNCKDNDVSIHTCELMRPVNSDVKHAFCTPAVVVA